MRPPAISRPGSFLTGAPSCVILSRFPERPYECPLQCFFDGKFGVDNGACLYQCDTDLHSIGIQKDNPFPTTWIGRFNHGELNRFLFHSLSQDEAVKPIRTRIAPRLRRQRPEGTQHHAVSIPGRTVRLAKQTKTFSKFAMPTSLLIRSKPS